MHQTLTERMRRVLDRAQDEARGLNQEFVGTEHLLLAVLAIPSTPTATILRNHHADPAETRTKLISMIPAGESAPGITGKLPMSPKAQRAINTALVMAQSLREPKLSTRVLLLSMMDEPDSAIRKALAEAGVDPEELQRALAEKPDTPEN